MTRIAGVDEAGRGPLAGPVVAAAVILPKDYSDPAITDSKKLSAKKREYLYEQIIRDAEAYAIVAVGARRIDQHNILRASLLAMKFAAQRVRPDFVYVDGNFKMPWDIPQEAVIGGDAKIIQISAASILAKVYRDRLMKMLALKYPGYGLERHAGYPTKLHLDAIKTLGPSRIHRREFRGVKEYIINSA